VSSPLQARGDRHGPLHPRHRYPPGGHQHGGGSDGDDSDDHASSKRGKPRHNNVWDLQATHGNVVADARYGVNTEFFERLWHRWLLEPEAAQDGRS